MNPAHLHLLLNHFPTVGFAVGIGLLLVAMFGRSFELKRASLVIIFLCAAMTILTYVSGNDAQISISEEAGISLPMVYAHETAALFAVVAMQIAGFFAWVGLWSIRRISRLPGWNVGVVLALSVVTFVMMARAAYAGGAIRHPEIMSADVAAAIQAQTPLARQFGDYIENHTWVWPTCETVHFVGLSLLFGVVLALDLRMLGMGKTLSFASLYQLLPLGILGFGLNLLTGLMFCVATPKQYTGFLFFLKMVLVVLGAVNVLYFMLCDAPWKVGEGDDAPATTKLVAASAIVIWIAVLFCGHMLPFLGNSF